MQLISNILILVDAQVWWNSLLLEMHLISYTFMDAFDIITELHLRDKEIQEIGSWVKECSSLPRLVLNKMQIV